MDNGKIGRNENGYKFGCKRIVLLKQMKGIKLT